MEKNNNSEILIADINKNKFFKEFTFSKNNFQSATKNKELEFADNVVWIEDILLLIQIKDRNPKNAKSAKKENNWFKNKVLTKGKKQIEDSIEFLNSASNIIIENERGSKICISDAKDSDVRKIIIYSSSDKLSKIRRLQKYCKSDKVGFIHLLNSIDYKWLCRILFTPTEIDSYLLFREQIVTKHLVKTKLLPEQAILGQFLSGHFELEPNFDFIKYWQQLDDDPNDYSIHHLLDRFPKKIEFEPHTNSYYKFILEFALLTRNELKLFKERFNIALSQCESTNISLPSRFVVPRRNIGFILIPIPLNELDTSNNALRNFTYGHKYEQKIKKCIGVSIAKDKTDFVILWDYIESEWKFDQYWEDLTKKDSPLSKVKNLQIPLYNFKK